MAEVKLSCLEAQFILRLLDERNVALEGVAKLLDENLKEENDPTGILVIQLAHKGIDAENLLIRHVSRSILVGFAADIHPRLPEPSLPAIPEDYRHLG